MNINIFDLSNPGVPYFYERKLSSLIYDKDEWMKRIDELLKDNNFPKNILPWGQKRNSDVINNFNDYLKEFFTLEELGSTPMHLKYTYHTNKNISDNIIDYCWNIFRNEINKIRTKTHTIGQSQCFQSFFSIPSETKDCELVSNIPEMGFVNNPLLEIKTVFNNFVQGKKIPIFIEVDDDNKKINTSSFCEILINYKYCSNSPVDIIFGGKGIANHNCGNVDVPKIENIGEYLINKLDISKEKYIINFFLDRVNLEDWWLFNKSVYEDKCYLIRYIKILEKKEDYRKDLINQICVSKKIYKTIIEYDKNNLILGLDECKNLLHKLISIE